MSSFTIVEGEVVLVDRTGNALPVTPGAAMPGSPRALLSGGTDGTNAHVLLVDASGRPVVVGAAATGSPLSGAPVRVGGSDGTNARDFITDSRGLQFVDSAALAAAMTRFSGSSCGVRDGYVSTSAIATLNVLSNTYIEQASNAQRSIVSTSANDTNTAGTGARKVRITYMPSDMSGLLSEVVSLSGTTAVNTVATNIRFIESMEVTEAGSTLTNAGTINLKAATAGAGVTVAILNPGDRRTHFAHHYVATGKTCYIRRIDTCNQTVIGTYQLDGYDPTNPLSPPITKYGFIRHAANMPPQQKIMEPFGFAGPLRLVLAIGTAATTVTTWYGGFQFMEF